jgi:hypothetical protein
MNGDRALVLKTFSDDQRVALFTKSYGKLYVDYSSAHRSIRPRSGYFMYGTLVQRENSRYAFHKISLDTVLTARSNSLTFSHTLVELLYWMLPVGIEHLQLFEWIERLAILDMGVDKDVQKVIRSAVVVRLLGFVGYIPPDRLTPLVSFLAWYENKLQENDASDSCLLREVAMRYAGLCILASQWVRVCLSEHPQVSELRAIWLELGEV